MKYKPVYEHQDGRGFSERYKSEMIARKKARQAAAKLMGANYFTNPNEMIDLTHGKYNNDDRGHGGVNFPSHGSRFN